MKRKIEKFLLSKYKNDMSKIRDKNSRLAIGGDVEACLMAIRSSTSAQGRPELRRIRKETSTTKSKEEELFDSSPHRRTYQNSQTYSTQPVPMLQTHTNYQGQLRNSKRSRALSPSSSGKDIDALRSVLSTLRGGYVNGMYLSALERRRIAENANDTEIGTAPFLSALNLTNEERKNLPRSFQGKVYFNAPYHGPSSALTAPANNELYTRTPTGKFPVQQNLLWALPSPMIPMHAYNKRVSGGLSTAFRSPTNRGLNPFITESHIRPSPLALSLRDDLSSITTSKYQVSRFHHFTPICSSRNLFSIHPICARNNKPFSPIII